MYSLNVFPVNFFTSAKLIENQIFFSISLSGLNIFFLTFLRNNPVWNKEYEDLGIHNLDMAILFYIFFRNKKLNRINIK